VGCRKILQINTQSAFRILFSPKTWSKRTQYRSQANYPNDRFTTSKAYSLLQIIKTPPKPPHPHNKRSPHWTRSSPYPNPRNPNPTTKPSTSWGNLLPAESEKNPSVTAPFVTRRNKTRQKDSRTRCMPRKSSRKRMAAAPVSRIKCRRLWEGDGMEWRSRRFSWKNSIRW